MLLVLAHGPLRAFARWLPLGRAGVARCRRACHLGGLNRWATSLAPLLTYLCVRQLELQGRSLRVSRADCARCLAADYLGAHA